MVDFLFFNSRKHKSQNGIMVKNQFSVFAIATSLNEFCENEKSFHFSIFHFGSVSHWPLLFTLAKTPRFARISRKLARVSVDKIN
jgi:hypothetical protein